MHDLSPRPGELEPIETASADELRALQLRRLRWTVRHAYDNVPHYRASFDAAGVHPDDVTDLGDLAKLPFTAKADLRANYPFGMFAVPREQVIRRDPVGPRRLLVRGGRRQALGLRQGIAGCCLIAVRERPCPRDQRPRAQPGTRRLAE